MILPPAIFGAFALIAFFGLGRDGAGDLESRFEGRQAPALPTETLDGYAPASDDMLRNGEVTLVNFWASWCPPCRAEHPVLLEMQDAGLRIIGVNYKDRPEQAISYLTEDDNPFMAVPVDPVGRTAIEWGVTGPPETFIVAGDGTILYKHVGPLVGSYYEQSFVPKLNAALGR
ncbi:DsbE family thiol:disulfide interchange protein [Cognatishimia sp. F0-27]|uniref:DsbE family thiol:disulfide interchange protein n=1 Tax=Cognatishimia sp. F0-27 TaxID=2816855 RepID=UPI001D0C9D71|nr:DsbE family thiol:disulfide interchange protein [Cognatishimia sp. F0-27]